MGRPLVLPEVSETHFRETHFFLGALEPASAPVVGFAIWFHDAIYAPLAGDNEEASAELARARLRLMALDARLIDRVATFILATKRHELLEASPELEIFLDLDLSILASPKDVYDEYARAVRREYRPVPEALYRHGRRKVLRGFLARPRLYYSPLADRFEARARENIARELARLEGEAQ